jgi:hypothetical protein
VCRTIEYPAYKSPPVVYEVNLETDEAIKCNIQPTVEKIKVNNSSNTKRSIARWLKREIIKGQSFRFEWKERVH